MTKVKQVLIKHIPILLLILLVISCQESKSVLKNHYNEKEITSIVDLVEFFKDQICEGEFSQELMTIKLNAILDSLNSGQNYLVEMDTKLMNQKLNNSFKTLQDNTFSNQCYAIDRTTSLKISHFCLKSNSSYMEFLKQLGKSNEGIETYRKKFAALATVSPTAVGHIIMSSKQDKYSEDIMTVIAFHFLHLNSELEAQRKLEIEKSKLEVY